MKEKLVRFAFWGDNNSPGIRSFQRFVKKAEKGTSEVEEVPNFKKVAASFSCQNSCHCTP